MKKKEIYKVGLRSRKAHKAHDGNLSEKKKKEAYGRPILK